ARHVRPERADVGRVAAGEDPDGLHVRVVRERHLGPAAEIAVADDADPDPFSHRGSPRSSRVHGTGRLRASSSQSNTDVRGAGTGANRAGMDHTAPVWPQAVLVPTHATPGRS